MGRSAGGRGRRGSPSVLAGASGVPPRGATPPGERCELCATPIPDDHDHVVDLEQRSLQCTCRGLLPVVHAGGAGGSRYRAVPDRFLSFPDFALSPGQWDSLQIPVSVAFFFLNSTTERVAAFYPGPAGATESLLSFDTWDEVVAANPGLAALLPDVEAFLVRTASGAGARPSATSCRSTPATSSSASSAGCGGASTAARRRTTRWRPSSTTFGPGPGRWP